MKQAILLLAFCLPVFCSAQKKERKIHASIEVGTSAYSFLDGRGMKIDYNWNDVFAQKPDEPLLRLNASYLKHNIAITFECFSHCYICSYYEENAVGETTLPVANDFLIGFLQARRFTGTSISYGYDVLAKGKFAITPYIGVFHRSSSTSLFDGEYFVEDIIPHIGRPYNIIIYKSNFYNDWGPTAQVFARYSILPKLTVSVKADYIRFGDNPKAQIGVGALVGFRW